MIACCCHSAVLYFVVSRSLIVSAWRFVCVSFRMLISVILLCLVRVKCSVFYVIA